MNNFIENDDLSAKKFDLHSHTLASDGVLSTQQLLQRAVEKNVDVLAITDHDTLCGLPATDSVPEMLTVVPGVEISCTWAQKEIHIVGLGIDINNTVLQTGLAEQVAKRRERAVKIALKLEKSGVADCQNYVHNEAQDKVFCRTHFMRWLLEKGVVNDAQQAFKRYLGPKGKAYVKGDWMALGDAVDLINQAGGYAVIAHPGRYGFSNTKLAALVKDFTEAGGKGMEVVYPNVQADQTRHFVRLLERHCLYASAGSDFHDPATPWTELGRLAPIPKNCPAIWECLALTTEQGHRS